MKTVDRSKREPAGAVLSAITDAFVEHGSYLKAFLRRFIQRPQDIEDIAQEAYLRAFQVGQNADVEHPKALLFTIAKNIALNELRSKSRRVTDYIEECQGELEEEVATTEEELIAMERLELYCKAVDSLPEQCRRVYLLRKVHGLAHKEIAEKLNVTVRTVERHLQKGVIQCRAQMREENDSDANVYSKNSVANLRKDRG